MNDNETTGQTEQSVKQNINFFSENLTSYNEGVQNLDSYIILRKYINEAIKGIDSLLDIGNGGVFDYDTSLVSKIIGLDLFLDQLPADYHYPKNVTMQKGDALDIPYDENKFDAALMVMLLHHLVGKTVKDCTANVTRAITEAYRIIKPGGKMIIAESCVPLWFYYFEKAVFSTSARVIEKFCKHPPAFQYTPKILKSILLKHFSDVKIIDVPLGRWVLQFGVKIPTILTPVKVKIFVATK